MFPFPDENYVLVVRAARAAGVPPPPEPVAGVFAASLEALLAEPHRRRWRPTAAELLVIGSGQ